MTLPNPMETRGFEFIEYAAPDPAAMGQVLAPAVATLVGAGAHERIRTGFSRALRLMISSTASGSAASLPGPSRWLSSSQESAVLSRSRVSKQAPSAATRLVS